MYNNGVPGAYHLAMSGFGTLTTANKYEAGLRIRIAALNNRRALSKLENIAINSLLEDHKTDKVEAIITEKERLDSRGILQKANDLFDWIPDGYKFSQELISNVPNWTLYLGAGLLGAATYKRYKKRKK